MYLCIAIYSIYITMEETEKDIIQEVTNEEYKWGFTTDIATDTIRKGLDEDIVRLISKKKNEPEWLLEFRLEAFRRWQKMKEPDWAHLEYETPNYQDIIYFAAPKQEKKKSMDEVDPELLATFDKLGIPLREREALAGVAYDAIMDSVSVKTTSQKALEEKGIIFMPISDYIDLAVSKNAKASAGSGEGPKLGGRAAGEGDGAGTVAEISALMHRIRRLGPGKDADYEIIEGSAAEREIRRLSGSLSGIALIIGLLTLIGAAVALTNIMLICVSERTREVGIRRALGATRADIRKAYIVEAVIICQAGCIAGTLLGIICGNALGLYLHTDSSIPWDWVLASQAISITVGIAACALPARRAAAMDVVEALRCE